jgi:hypothetical protein
MKVDRAILAGAATVQFGSLVLVSNPETRALGFVLGIMTGAVLLLIAVGIQPSTWRRARVTVPHTGRPDA